MTINCPLCNQQLFSFNIKNSYYCASLYENLEGLKLQFQYHFILSDSKFIVRENNLRLYYCKLTKTLYVSHLNSLQLLLKIKTNINKAYDICKMDYSLLLNKIKLYQTFS